MEITAVVDTFTQTEFEQVLESIAPGGWEGLGLDDGEYVYDLGVPGSGLSIRVRSSVHSDGESAGAGQDSIRVYALDGVGEPWGSKLNRWVTRVSGWERRLGETVAALRELVKRVGECPECGAGCKPFRVKKEGPNKGRWFAKCGNARCKRPLFEWLDC